VLASVGADCNHLSHVTTQGAYAVLTGIVTILAYWMAGIYETPYVLFVAIIILFISMTLAMRFFGEEVVPMSTKASLSGQ
jgi:cobalamin biosynthesis protein CobD/CbiB